jgi:hypothetical protein
MGSLHMDNAMEKISTGSIKIFLLDSSVSIMCIVITDYMKFMTRHVFSTGWLILF